MVRMRWFKSPPFVESTSTDSLVNYSPTTKDQARRLENAARWVKWRGIVAQPRHIDAVRLVGITSALGTMTQECLAERTATNGQ